MQDLQMKQKEPTITQIESLQDFCKNRKSLKYSTVQNLDLRKANIDWRRIEVDCTTTLLGCQLELDDELYLIEKGAIVIKSPNSVPYEPFRNSLYTWQELMEGYTEAEDNSHDLKIYEHFSASRFRASINEALWQRIHDHAIDDALDGLLKVDDNGMSAKNCVGFMGGHGVERDSDNFARSAQTAKLLTEAGYFVVSGGGPGVMEAANFGAYMAGYSQDEFEQAIEILKKAPAYKDRQFHKQALEVLDLFPDGQASLAIPTWFYGHEPSNLFATYIAKYFSNSIREDTLLKISLHGVVFAPGSAGTTQEIFMDAAQNHYGSYNFHSPMVFLGRQRYEIDTLLYPLLRQLSHGRVYHDLLHITDAPEEVVRFLQTHPPVIKAAKD